MEGFFKKKYWIKSQNINHERIPEFEKKLQEKRKKRIPKGHSELFYSIAQMFHCSSATPGVDLVIQSATVRIPKEPA